MYKIQRDKENNKFYVIEIQTEKIMGIFDSHKEASVLYNFLKRGGGFNGWTPDFMFTEFQMYT